MRAKFLSALVAAVVVSAGCAGPEPAAAADDAAAPDASFVVPALRVGDRLVYHMGYSSAGFALQDTTTVRVIGASTVKDAGGHPRAALLVRQGDVADPFREDYWIDGQTYAQFKLLRSEQYSEVTRMSPPVPAVPPKTTYANGSGPMERYLENPLFEDANAFGVFASGLPLRLGAPFNVSGNLWERDSTDLLESGNWTAEPQPVSPDHATFGPLRRLSFEASWRDDDDFQTVAWTGTFSASVPLVVDMVRDLSAKFGSRTLDIRLNATLLAYEPGSGESFPRSAGKPVPAHGLLARGPAEVHPGAANDARIGFRFQEAFETLRLDPTASQFFTSHAGAYLRVAHMVEVDTCAFYPSMEYPGCHWYVWSGTFYAPDDYVMHFTVEKYHGGGASVAFTPIVPTEDVLDILFEAVAGEAPTQPPPAAVRVEKVNRDLLPRSAYPADAVTFAGAFDAFANSATETNRNRAPNLLVVYLTPGGYAYYVANIQWVFPPDPELFPLYDDMPLELDRHVVEIEASGHMVLSENYDVVLTHK